ncbi:MAG: hypothetical protein ACYC8T_05815, partial [Myxococcaceae bacterium]
MTRKTRRKRVDASQAGKYYDVAKALQRSAIDLADLGENAYGNAVAIVAIHSAIAYADALCIAYGGFKSTAGDHEDAADAMQDALGGRSEPSQVQTLLAIVKKKDPASYQGVYFTLADA